MTSFYDTSSMLAMGDALFKDGEHFFCSSVSLAELEHIKTNPNKSPDLKHKANKLTKLLDKHPNNYTVKICDEGTYRKCRETYKMIENNDNLILIGAVESKCDTVYSEDINMRVIGRDVFGLNTMAAPSKTNDEYSGYHEAVLTDNQLSSLYGEMDDNRFDCLINEYVVIKNAEGDYIDALKWDGDRYQPLRRSSMKSSAFGNVKPYNNDIYQQLAIDSMSTNQVTMLKGVAGTGKSYLALAFLFKQLEQRKIDRIIVFCNPLAVMSAARLGFYPGSRDQKILDSAPGAMLSSKLGDKFRVEQLCTEGRLILLPMSDIRGYDTTGMNAGIYVVEAQNMDIALAKLVMQRIGEDSVCVIDGDYNTQVDSNCFSGNNNGMRRISEVFRGHSVYGEVELKNIYRSEIARIAETM